MTARLKSDLEKIRGACRIPWRGDGNCGHKLSREGAKNEVMTARFGDKTKAFRRKVFGLCTREGHGGPNERKAVIKICGNHGGAQHASIREARTLDFYRTERDFVCGAQLFVATLREDPRLNIEADEQGSQKRPTGAIWFDIKEKLVRIGTTH